MSLSAPPFPCSTKPARPRRARSCRGRGGRLWKFAAGLLLTLALGSVPGVQAAGLAQPASGGLRLLAQEGGAVRAVAADGRFAYVGVGPRLVVLEARGEGEMAVVGRTEPLPSIVEEIVLGRGRAVVGLSDDSLHVVDLAEPERPRVAAMLPDDLEWRPARLIRGGRARRLAMVASGTAIVVAEDHRLRLFDLRDPWRPVEGAALELERDRSVAGLAVEGAQLFVGRYGMGYRVSPFVIDRIGVSRPDAFGPPEQVGGSAADAKLLGAVEGRFLLCADGRLRLSDGQDEAAVGDPSPTCSVWMTRVLPVPGGLVLVQGNQIWRISLDDEAPRSIRGVSGMFAQDAALYGDQLLVADAGKRLQRGRLVAGAWQARLGFEPTVGSVFDVHAEGGCLVVADDTGLRTFDVGSPEAPRAVGALAMGAPPFEVALWRGTGLIAQTTGEVRPVAADCASNPRILGPKAPSDRDAVGVAVDQGRTYALELWTTHGVGAGRLTALDFSNLAAPTIEELYDYAAVHGQQPAVLDVAAQGDRLAVVLTDARSSASWLSIVDPTALPRHREAGRVALPVSRVPAVLLDGERVYVAGHDALSVLRLSPDGAPRVETHFDLLPSAPVASGLPLDPVGSTGHVGMALDGGWLWQARGQSGVELVDVRLPALPDAVAAHETAGSARRIAAHGDVAFVADREGGLVVLLHVPDANGPATRGRIALPWAATGR